jgi:hypothetical protein
MALKSKPCHTAPYGVSLATVRRGLEFLTILCSDSTAVASGGKTVS